jgi:Tfp pilus assembly protein PilF
MNPPQQRFSNRQLFDRASDYFTQGNLQRAELDCRTILQSQTTHPDAWHLLGLIAAESDNPGAAVECINKAIYYAPKVADYHNNLGLILGRMRRYDEAEAAVRQAIAIKAEYPEALNNLGIVLFNQNKTDEALSMLDKALLIRPDYPEAINNKIKLLKKIDKRQEAIQFLDQMPGPDVGSTYRLIRVIGYGETSLVYLAERTSDKLLLVMKILDVPAVIKDLIEYGKNILSYDNLMNQFIIKFLQEGELLIKISSPYVLKIYEHGVINNISFIAMEYCSGGDLKQKIEATTTPAIANTYMIQIAKGLKAVHESGIIHRDLHPSNIMFRDDGILVLADFGLSIKHNFKFDENESKRRVGRFGYMSPEQYEGKTLDQRSDLYSAGVIFYELLIGNKPYPGKTKSELTEQHINEPVPSLPAKLTAYQEIIDKTMAKTPADRYQNAAELVQALESL